MWEWRYRNEAKAILWKKQPDNFIFRKIQYGILSWFRHDDIVISSLIFDVLLMCTLPLCCPNDSQKCEWKIINTEKTQRKKRKEKTSFWKREIGFLNFLRNITFTNFAIFQTFIIFLSTLRAWTTHDVHFLSAD